MSSPSAFKGLRALVVGGTNGIGRGIALALAEAEMGVTVCGRDEKRGLEVVSEMQKKGGSGHDFLQCDASRLANVVSCADGFVAKHPGPLDVLILTQGRASMEGWTDNGEGVDLKLALHYYSRMAFIERLLPALRQSAHPRVLSVLSAGVHGPYAHYGTDPALVKNFSLKAAADAAGFYNDLALDHFARQPENSTVAYYHAAPGLVHTSWGTELPLAVKCAVRILQPVLGRKPEKCGRLLSAPLLKPDAKPGLHLLGQNGNELVGKLTKLHSDEARQAVWKHTTEVFSRTGVTAAAKPT